MAFIPVANVCMVELIYTWDGQRCENTLYIEFPGAWTVLTMTALLTEITDWWSTEMAIELSSDLTLVLVRGSDLSSQNGIFVESTGNLPVSGVNVTESVPNNVAGCITFGTGLRGRSYRGRNYIPGMTNANVANNTIAPTSLGNIEAAYAALSSYIQNVDIGCDHVVVSRYTNNAPRTAGITTPVISYTMDNIVDSQRRRLPGRGS